MKSSLHDAALSALILSERWMAQVIKTCEAESESTLLPRGYPSHLKTVRRAIKMLKENFP